MLDLEDFQDELRETRTSQHEEMETERGRFLAKTVFEAPLYLVACHVQVRVFTDLGTSL